MSFECNFLAANQFSPHGTIKKDIFDFFGFLSEILSYFVLQMLHNMKGQFAEHLMHAGFVSSPDPKDSMSNVNSGNLGNLGNLGKKKPFSVATKLSNMYMPVQHL